MDFSGQSIYDLRKPHGIVDAMLVRMSEELSFQSRLGPRQLCNLGVENV